jgi:hypothetical protein
VIRTGSYEELVNRLVEKTSTERGAP